MKAKSLTTLVALMFFLNSAYAQFSNSDVTLVVTGLSETSTKKFKENKSIFIEALNKYEIPDEIKPLKLEVSYKNKQGFVKLTVNLDINKIYSNDSKYKSHGDQFRAYGKVISFYLQDQLMRSLSEYKFAVAREGYSVKKDLADFESVLSLKKATGDIMNVYAYNSVGNGGYGGLYPYYFYSKIDMRIGGKVYKTECGNIDNLNDYKIFFVEDIEGLDGKKTGAYYFCKFYNIPLN